MHGRAEIQVNTIRRWGRNFGEAFVPGANRSMSVATVDNIESMRRSLIHETGHHMQEVGGADLAAIARSAFSNPVRRPITGYAGSQWDEYLAESWTAYQVNREDLQTYDPVGYKMIQEILSLLRLSKL